MEKLSRPTGLIIAAAIIAAAIVFAAWPRSQPPAPPIAEITVAPPQKNADDEIRILKAKADIERQERIADEQRKAEADKRAAAERAAQAMELARLQEASRNKRNSETLVRLQRFVETHPDVVPQLPGEAPSTTPKAFEAHWDELTKGIRTGQLPNRTLAIELADFITTTRQESEASKRRSQAALPDYDFSRFHIRCGGPEWDSFKAALLSLEF